MAFDFLESIFVNFLCVFDRNEVSLYKSLITRCITYALLVSHDIRRDTSMTVLIRNRDAYDMILLVGNELRQLRPDERSTWGILRKALKRLNTLKKRLLRAHWGVYVLGNMGSEDVEKLRSSHKCIIITERTGEDILTFNLPKESLFIVFNIKPSRLKSYEYELICPSNSHRYAIGEMPLDYAISIVNWVLDNRVRMRT